MQGSLREVVLLGLTTITTTGSSNDINLPQAFQSATVTLNVSTVSGTSPTMVVYIQRKLGQAAATDVQPVMPTGTGIYDDLLAFATITTSTTIRIANLVAGLNPGSANTTVNTASDWANSVQSLAASSQRLGVLGGIWKVGYVLGGTSPSFAFSVVSQFVPFGQ